MTVLIAGPAGAEPEQLAAELGRRGCGAARVLDGPAGLATSASADTAPTAVLLAVDPTLRAGTEEARLLARLRGYEVPVALVCCRAEAVADWPRVFADARLRLDPGRTLPVFAVSVLLAGADDPRSGLAELADWCRAPDAGGAPAIPERAAPDVVGETAVPPHREPDREQAVAVRQRTERITGARAGFAVLRGELAAASRDRARQLADLGASGCRRISRREVTGYRQWLTAQTVDYQRRLTAELIDGIEAVRAAALLGLPGAGVPDEHRGPPVPAAPPAAPTEPLSRPGAEDLLVLLLGLSAGVGLGRAVVAPLADWAGIGMLGTVLTAVAGLLLAAGIVAVRRQSALRGAVQRWTAETLSGARAGVEQAVAAGLGAAEARLNAEIWNRTGASCVQPSRERGLHGAAHRPEGHGDGPLES